MCGSDIFLGILAIFFPPVSGLRPLQPLTGSILSSTPPTSTESFDYWLTHLFTLVWIKVGVCTADSIINLALCCLGYVPGLLHAWYIILKHPEPDYDDPSYEPIPGGPARGRDVENGRVTYYYVSHQPDQPQQPRAYGTLGSQNPAQSPGRQAAPKPQQAHPVEGGSSSQSHDESRPPPTYAEAVKGDNKVQTDE